jgi:hypothetical protein
MPRASTAGGFARRALQSRHDQVLLRLRWHDVQVIRGVIHLVSSVQYRRGMLGKSDELRDRVEARKHELLAKYSELKADSRKEAAEARTRLKARLDELESHLRIGWEKVSDDVRTKLNHWLERKDA